MSSIFCEVNTKIVKPYMECGICKEVYREATSITDCLHTFCRICIHEKISKEDNPCCPVCKNELGSMPEEKLRPNHNLQTLTANIFPPKGSNVEIPQVTPSDIPSVKRKEGSLSPSVESTPKVSATSKAISTAEETLKRVENSMEERLEGPSSPKTLNKIMQNKHQICYKLMEDNSKGVEGKVDGQIWISLVASEDQVGCEQLPQLSSTYLRIKDLSMNVSTLQKYLAMKLDLANETEVEIMYLGEALVPDLKLSRVLEAWINASSSSKTVQVSAGDSGKDHYKKK